MAKPLIPLVILAGSDRSAHDLPEGSEEFHPLNGVKGFELAHHGRPLIDSVVERFLSTKAFGPCYVAGPAAVFGSERENATIVDTDSSFGENLEAGIETLARCHPGSRVAVTTCDVLPDRDELLAVLEDYWQHAPLDFWYPLVLSPANPGELGSAAWKPRYRIPPREGESPREILPGHLLVINLSALRTNLIYRACTAAYRSRNRPVLSRLMYISSNILAYLLKLDLSRLFQLRAPIVTWEVLRNGFVVAFKLRRGALSEEQLARCLHSAFTTSEHRRRHPEGKARMPGLKGLSLAKDIDTVEEAAELLEAEETDPNIGSR